MKYATRKLKEVKGLRIFGEAKNKISVISFNIESIHPYDLGSILDKMGIGCLYDCEDNRTPTHGQVKNFVNGKLVSSK